MIQLKDFVGSVVDSFLGPNKNNKLLIQNKDVSIARCPLYLFRNIEFQDPISFLIEETLLAHHDVYGCTTLSLLAMWYFWSEEFKFAIQEGCQVQNIIKHSQNILELTISTLSNNAVNFDETFFKKHDLKRTSNKVLEKHFNQGPISLGYSSRHFSPSFVSEKYGEHDERSRLSEDCLKTVIESLDHDGDAEISNLLLECWRKQTPSTSCPEFKTDGLLLYPIILPCSSSSVIDGLLIKISNSNYSWFTDSKIGDANRSLMIKGDITYEYVHLGFSPKVAVKTKKEIWLKKTCESIKQLNLDILLVKDDIDPEVASFCVSQCVLVLTHIPVKTFKLLCKALHHSPCTYLRDIKEGDIITNLKIRNWKPTRLFTSNETYFLLNTDFESKLQTIVLCHPLEAVLKKMEHQMHHFISRLDLSFKSKKLLAGGSTSEEWCCHFLKKSSQFHHLDDATSRIVIALANGFQNYSEVILKKRSSSPTEAHRIYDELSSKLSAWRSALSLVLLTLQCDSVITNDSQILPANTL